MRHLASAVTAIHDFAIAISHQLGVEMFAKFEELLMFFSSMIPVILVFPQMSQISPDISRSMQGSDVGCIYRWDSWVNS